MSNYLSYQFNDTPEFINTFDEVPLWSASFGLFMLKHIELKANITVVDIGSGAGFPLIELAERLGQSSKVYGMDPWLNANNRARQKIKNFGISNVEIIDGSAEKILLKNNSVDLIVSNLGINNFDNPEIVFNECKRILKPDGRLVLTTNLNGHWKIFYEIFYQTLERINKRNLISVLKKEEEHRGTVESISEQMKGFKITRQFEENLEMKFLNGTAFLNHHFIKVGWVTSWMKLFPQSDLIEIFSAVEEDLNNYSIKNNGLKLTVPMAYIEAVKI